MSRYGTPVCSDEQLLEELSKLGYDDVSSDVFNKMKQDLSDLLEREAGHNSEITEGNQDDASVSGFNHNLSQVSLKYSSSDASVEYIASQENVKKVQTRPSRKIKKKLHNSSSRLTKSHEDDEYDVVSNHTSYNTDEQAVSRYTGSFDSMYGEDISQDQYSNTDVVKSRDNYMAQNFRMDHNRNDYEYTTSGLPNETDELLHSSRSNSVKQNQGSLINKSKNKPAKDIKLTSNRKKAQNYGSNKYAIQKTENDHLTGVEEDTSKTTELERNYSESNESSVRNRISDINLNTSDSVGGEKKTIKRKVLRRRNGKSTITEELVEIPSIFDTSYPESENFNSSKSFSSDDLSFKSNNSTGSITTASPESSMKSSPSTLSLVSSRSTSLRVTSTRKKKNDPVTMYGYYKKYWDNFRPPGENKHDRLRFAIRDKMLEYNI